MGDTPPDRCGYTFPEDHKAEDYPNHQNCCWRETFDESNSCIWHAGSQEVSKSVESLQETRVPPEIREQNSPHTELLDGANLDNIKLDSEISFKGVALRQANLSEADLEGVKLNDANLDGADISDGYLVEADLTEANLHEVDLSGGQLYRANLSGAGLKGANLTEASLTGADLTDATLTSVDLTEAALGRANLNGAWLYDAILKKAYIKGADFMNANLYEAELQRVNAEGADFTCADLSESSLAGADCVSGDFKNAVLVRASLENADLADASLAGAHLFGTQLEGVRIDSTTQLVAGGGVGEVTVAERCRYDTDAPPEGPEASLAKPEGTEEESMVMYSVDLEDAPDPPRVIQLRRAKSTYHRLEDLARQNGFPGLQSRMFKRRQEMGRLLLREQGERTRWLFAEVQRRLFIYGESFRRILGISVGIVTLFWLLFLTTGTVQTAGSETVTVDTVRESPVLVWETLYHSILVFFTGRAPLSAIGTAGQVLITLEIIAGPILLALLVFVLGRRAAR